MNFDRTDSNIQQEYKFYKGKTSPTKYIATTVEAILGEIYKTNNKDLDSIIKLVTQWTNL